METTADEEELKQECLDRMKLLKLDEQIIKDFVETGYIYATEVNEEPQKADDKLMEALIDYGNRRNVKVYYILVSPKHGNIYNWDFYCVSNYKSDWNAERENAINGNFNKIHEEWKIENN